MAKAKSQHQPAKNSALGFEASLLATAGQRADNIQPLAEHGIDFQQVALQAGKPGANPFDLLCHLAFNAPVLTRRQPAGGRAGFVMANSTRSAHSCSMTTTEDARKQNAEQGVIEEALERGMKETAKEFVEEGAEA